MDPKASPSAKKSKGARLKAAFLAKLPALKRLLDDVQAAAKARGYLKGLDGRRLTVRSPHAALNTLLQSAGALVAKLSVVLWFDDMTAAGYTFGKEYALCVQCHDEHQAETIPPIAEDTGRRMVEAMQKAGEFFSFRCPVDGEFKIGETWADTH